MCVSCRLRTSLSQESLSQDTLGFRKLAQVLVLVLFLVGILVGRFEDCGQRLDHLTNNARAGCWNLAVPKVSQLAVIELKASGRPTFAMSSNLCEG